MCTCPKENSRFFMLLRLSSHLMSLHTSHSCWEGKEEKKIEKKCRFVCGGLAGNKIYLYMFPCSCHTIHKLNFSFCAFIVCVLNGTTNSRYAIDFNIIDFLCYYQLYLLCTCIYFFWDFSLLYVLLTAVSKIWQQNEKKATAQKA